jgi:hypothetical protein
MKTIEINGIKFTCMVENHFFIVESNHGNHSGFNRKWSVWSETYEAHDKARIALGEHMDDLNDDHPDYISYGPLSAAEYDLRYFRVVNLEGLESLLNGTSSTPNVVGHWAFEKEEYDEDFIIE